MDRRAGAGGWSEDFSRLWRRMQRIEICRHRAEMAERRAAQGSEAFRNEMAEIAGEWRDLAKAIEDLDSTSDLFQPEGAAASG